MTEGEEALDLSFRPEEFDFPTVGDKTLPDLVREMESRSQISTADKERITERELEVAAGTRTSAISRSKRALCWNEQTSQALP